MVGSVIINGLMGLAYVIVLLFSTGSLESLLTTPTGFPFMQIYLDVTKSRAGTTVMSLLLILIAIAAATAGAWGVFAYGRAPVADFFAGLPAARDLVTLAVLGLAGLNAYAATVFSWSRVLRVDLTIR